LRIVRAVAVLLVAAGCVAASSITATAAPDVRYGIQDDAWLEFGPGKLTDRVAQLDRLGIDVVRVTLDWDTIEPAAGRYDWRWPDRLLKTLRAHGLAALVTLWGTPGWANGGTGPNRVPQSGSDFAEFARTAAARYRFVSLWAIWNEPNQPRWLNPVSPAAYVTRLLNPAYRAIKAVNPAAKVAGGVTSPRANRGGMSPIDFIRGMRRAGARLDAYAHNPYPASPSETPSVGGCKNCRTITMATLERLERELFRDFPRARIWLTEYGYQTDPPDPFGVSLALQARYVGEAARRVYTLPKVDLLIHYLYRDEPDLARWQSGLETVAGRVKPALRSMMFPLVEVSRHGATTRVWGQVRPGTGRQRYVLQLRGANSWAPLGGVRLSSARGYFTRTVHAGKGSRIRLWYPARRVASPELVVR
jgi:hypothetical protein